MFDPVSRKLLWTARGISFVPAILMLVAILIIFPMTYFGDSFQSHIMHYHTTKFNLLFWPFILLLLSFFLIASAWRWHLPGGAAIVILSSSLFIRFLIYNGTKDSGWIALAFLSVLFTSGLLYLAEGLRERRVRWRKAIVPGQTTNVRPLA